MEKRLLVTGGTGFLGGHVLAGAVGGWKVRALMRSDPPRIPGVEWFAGDLEDTARIAEAVRSYRPRALIHAAAMGNVDLCETEWERAFLINTEAPALLASVCAEVGCRFVMISSDMVFDGERGMYRETDPAGPVNYYGETKRMAEERVLAACPGAVCVRSALIYGAPAYSGTSFSDQMVRRLREGKNVRLFMDQYRSPIAAANLAEALLELAESDFSGILHLGGPERIDRFSFGRILARSMGFSESLLVPVGMHDSPTVGRRPRDVSFDVSLAGIVLKTRLMGCEEGLMAG
jgi:dTDP-4-dehydrorhamnose reductase